MQEQNYWTDSLQKSMETFEIGFQHITELNGDIWAFFISFFNKQGSLKTKSQLRLKNTFVYFENKTYFY